MFSWAHWGGTLLTRLPEAIAESFVASLLRGSLFQTVHVWWLSFHGGCSLQINVNTSAQKYVCIVRLPMKCHGPVIQGYCRNCKAGVRGGCALANDAPSSTLRWAYRVDLKVFIFYAVFLVCFLFSGALWLALCEARSQNGATFTPSDVCTEIETTELLSSVSV